MTDTPATPDEPVPPTAEGTSPPGIGWGRAAASSLVILVVGILGCVYVPNLIVTKLTSLTPGARADLAAGVCIVVLLALAWGLRRAQSHGLI